MLVRDLVWRTHPINRNRVSEALTHPVNGGIVVVVQTKTGRYKIARIYEPTSSMEHDWFRDLDAVDVQCHIIDLVPIPADSTT